MASISKSNLLKKLRELHANASSAPWCFCDEKPNKYFPHVHFGVKDHDRTYLSGGFRYPSPPRYITINEGVPPGEDPKTFGGTTHETCVANGKLIVELRNLLPQIIRMLEDEENVESKAG